MDAGLTQLLTSAAGAAPWSSATVVVAGAQRASYVADNVAVPAPAALTSSDIASDAYEAPSPCPPRPSFRNRELPGLFASKQAAMEAGVPLRRQEGVVYSIHHFFPSVRTGVDVLYGRTGDASAGEGVAVARLFARPDAPPTLADCFILITYRLPIVSALAVPKLLNFAENSLRPVVIATEPAAA